jgi:CRP/FNR family transcriptional regulator, cyclic AMP receptor protein
MQDAERSKALAKVALLETMPPAGVATLAASCLWRSYDRGQEIIGQDSDNKDVFFVAQGRVRVTFFAPNGTEIAFRDLSAGASFGELSAIDGLARSASVVALANTVLASLSRARFQALLREQPSVTERVLRNLASLVRSLTERVVDFSTLAVQNRIQAELLRMANEAGVSRNRAQVSPVPRHAEIASRIATNREAVAREFARLGRLGVIERQRGALVIADIARLAAMVEAVREG